MGLPPGHCYNGKVANNCLLTHLTDSLDLLSMKKEFASAIYNVYIVWTNVKIMHIRHSMCSLFLILSYT